jgi:hypothetical protein
MLAPQTVEIHSFVPLIGGDSGFNARLPVRSLFMCARILRTTFRSGRSVRNFSSSMFGWPHMAVNSADKRLRVSLVLLVFSLFRRATCFTNTREFLLHIIPYASNGLRSSWVRVQRRLHISEERRALPTQLCRFLFNKAVTLSQTTEPSPHR